jgi:hypothetical protein
MKDGEVDVFLGDWQPSLAADRQPYLDDGSVTVLGANLEGAKYMLEYNVWPPPARVNRRSLRQSPATSAPEGAVCAVAL